MKPCAFDYERPRDLAGALALIAREDVFVKLLAGGQSLGPMLNLRLVQPDLLVDITAIPELTRIEETAEALVVGAGVTHADIEDGRVPDVTRGALPGVARHIAYRAVRNRGTLGGSLAHADPAADWISCLAALGAEALVRGAGGARAVAIDAFMTGAFEVALAPAEMLEAVRVPRSSPEARWGFCKIARKTGEMAQAIGAVLYDPARDICRAVMGATEARPIVLADATALFGGRPASGLARAFDSAPARRALEAAGIRDPIEQQLRIAALRRAAEQADRT